jgi:membrane protein
MVEGGAAERLIEVIRRHPAGRTILAMIDTLDHHHAPIAASAIAFDAFLSLVPLAALVGMVMSRLHENGELLLGPLLSASPKPVADLVIGAITRDQSASVVAPLSIAAFIWTSSAGISTAMSVFERMFHSPERPWWWRRGIAMICVVAGVAILAAVAGIIVGVGLLSFRAGAVVAVLFPTVTLLGMLTAFFRIAVRRGPIFLRRRVVPGVLVTIVLWLILSVIFSFYVSTLARYATLYGGLAAVAIFLFWLWLLALALLVGGEVNAMLDGVRDDAAASRARGGAGSAR